jgi:hypothetical protein
MQTAEAPESTAQAQTLVGGNFSSWCCSRACAAKHLRNAFRHVYVNVAVYVQGMGVLLYPEPASSIPIHGDIHGDCRACRGFIVSSGFHKFSRRNEILPAHPTPPQLKLQHLNSTAPNTVCAQPQTAVTHTGSCCDGSNAQSSSATRSKAPTHTCSCAQQECRS